jgi:hypothetical protein
MTLPAFFRTPTRLRYAQSTTDVDDNTTRRRIKLRWAADNKTASSPTF